MNNSYFCAIYLKRLNERTILEDHIPEQFNGNYRSDNMEYLYI